MAIGTAAPMNAQAATMPLLASEPYTFSEYWDSVMEYQRSAGTGIVEQNQTGKGPSGLVEAWRSWSAGQKKAALAQVQAERADLERAKKRAMEQGAKYNETALQNGLPSLEEINRKLLEKTEEEGRLVGNAASPDGLQVVIESTPAWLADP
jgi:hypothetical protein